MSFPATFKEELKLRPPSSNFIKLTPVQYALRQSIAQHICQDFLEEDSTLTDDFRRMYRAFPMWQVYKDKESGLIKRVYGVAKNTKGQDVLHTATCHISFVNLTVGGTPAESLEPVVLTEADLARIQLCSSPGVFCDPLGFLVVLEQEAA